MWLSSHWYKLGEVGFRHCGLMVGNGSFVVAMCGGWISLVGLTLWQWHRLWLTFVD